MTFISLAKHNSGNEEVNTASVSTASSNIGAASTSQDTACAYIASQSNGSQIKFEDINQIDKDDIEEMDIKWNMALLSMRADRFWKKTGKKITIQGTDVAGAPRSQNRGRKDNYRQGSKIEEHALKALMAIDGVGWDWSYMVNDEENHALVADEEAPMEFALMAKTSTDSEELIYKVHRLQVLFIELDRFEILLGEQEEDQVDLQEKRLGYEIQSSFASITLNDQGFTVDMNMDDFLVTENFWHDSWTTSPYR
nr:hypothetical protein [Tanacetum cinerariifolium]